MSYVWRTMSYVWHTTFIIKLYNNCFNFDNTLIIPFNTMKFINLLLKHANYFLTLQYSNICRYYWYGGHKCGLLMEEQYYIWSVACVNWEFDGGKCSFIGDAERCYSFSNALLKYFLLSCKKVLKLLIWR